MQKIHIYSVQKDYSTTVCVTCLLHFPFYYYPVLYWTHFVSLRKPSKISLIFNYLSLTSVAFKSIVLFHFCYNEVTYTGWHRNKNCFFIMILKAGNSKVKIQVRKYLVRVFLLEHKKIFPKLSHGVRAHKKLRDPKIRSFQSQGCAFMT